MYGFCRGNKPMHQRSISPADKFLRELKRVRRQFTGLLEKKHPAPQPIPSAYVSNIDIAPLRERYERSSLAEHPDTFCLWRIIGNDLPPRHKTGQSFENVKFILKYEPDLPGCSKHWLLNRISDAGEQQRIVALLESYGHTYECIPFSLEEYRSQPFDFDGLPDEIRNGKFRDVYDDAYSAAIEVRIRRLKNNYVMNNNGARNYALERGRALAKWVLPWDGNCFLTMSAWEEIRRTVQHNAWFPYFVVPMARVIDNRLLLKSNASPEAVEEPQIIFRADSGQCFDERYYYSRRPKVELLWRLGVPGPWDQHVIETFDFARPEPCTEAGQFMRAGWVARLNSGNRKQEVGRKSAKYRGRARDLAVISFLDRLDAAAAAGRKVAASIGTSFILAIHTIADFVGDPLWLAAQAF
jgi:hypothetical protein